MPLLILASASKRRKDLLMQAGITPDKILASDIDETPLKMERPQSYALRMASEKAAKIYLDNPKNFVLAADTVVSHGRTILPKAENDTEIRQCLEILSGRSHQVITSVCLIAPNGKQSLNFVASRVSFKRLSQQEITAYVNSKEGVGKAGGYAIQGLAGCFVKSINGSYSGIVGLPLCETVNMLNGLGYKHGQS